MQLQVEWFKRPDASKTFSLFYGWSDCNNLTKFHFCMYNEWLHTYFHHWFSLYILKDYYYTSYRTTVHIPSPLKTCTSKKASQLFLQLVLWRLTDNKLCLNCSHSSSQLDRLGKYPGQIILKFLFAVSSSNTDYGEEKENLVLSFPPEQTKSKLGSSLIPQINRGFSNSCDVYSNLGEDKVEESQHETSIGKRTELSKQKT